MAKALALANLTPQKAVALMNDKAREKYEEIRAIRDETIKLNVQRYWELGKWIFKTEAEEKTYAEKHDGEEEPTLYGKNFMGLLAVALGLNPTTLYNCKQLYAMWSTKEKFEPMLTWRNANGDPLSYTHLCHLVSVARCRSGRSCWLRPRSRTGRLRNCTSTFRSCSAVSAGAAAGRTRRPRARWAPSVT